MSFPVRGAGEHVVDPTLSGYNSQAYVTPTGRGQPAVAPTLVVPMSDGQLHVAVGGARTEVSRQAIPASTGTHGATVPVNIPNRVPQGQARAGQFQAGARVMPGA